MPFISVKTSAKLSEQVKLEIERELTDSISLLPGKTSRYFMCAVEDNISMMFHSDKALTAFVEVKIFGRSTREAYTALTAKICDILQENAGVEPDFCYVKFEEVENWGFNKGLF